LRELLIIGNGGAALTAAIEAKESGLDVVVVGESYPTRSQTSMAQGGINAALDGDENSHINDTLKASHSLSHKEMVTLMCSKAKESIDWLNSILVPFSRDESGNIAQRKLGGASKSRACYSQDYTGLKILHSLFDNSLRRGVEFINEHLLLDLIVYDGKVYGAVFLDMRETKVVEIRAKATILATGGYANIYEGFSTNANQSRGDAVSIALKAGAQLSNLEFVQFHPTALKGSNTLISESARGAGGKLINSIGERFVDELKPRDEVSRAIWEQMKRGREVFLDIRELGEDFINETIPQERKLSIAYAGVDPLHEPIPVNPAAHYSMGGIDVDRNLMSSIEGLFAVGECSNAKVHGANRLGGNSLLEIVAFGRIVAKNAKEYMENSTYDNIDIDTLTKTKKEIDNLFEKDGESFYAHLETLGRVMFENVGIVRDESSLKEALKAVEEMTDVEFGLFDKSRVYNTNLVELIKFKNSLLLSKAIILSALNRKESRGAHYRSDYKDEESLPKESVARYKNGEIEIAFREVRI
jgi:succinate dehydrogenase / fumarate reductase flavoprotein subunit